MGKHRLLNNSQVATIIELAVYHKHSFTAIGKAFGVDHKTVAHYVKNLYRGGNSTRRVIVKESSL